MNIYPYILSGILIVCGMTDVIRQVGVGSLTLQGVWTILLGISTFILVIVRHRIPSMSMMAIGFVLFLGIGVISVQINSSTSTMGLREQAQNLLVYAAFAGSIFLSAGEAYRDPVNPPAYLTKGFLWATQIAMGLYGLSLIQEGPGGSAVMSARSFAIFGIIAMSWLLANARNHSLPKAQLYAIGLLIMIAFSFSRTATIIGLLLYPLSQIKPNSGRSWFRMSLWIGLITLIAYLTFTYVTPIRDRFTSVGDGSSIGGIKVNTSGRSTLWESATASADEAPIFGKGPGSVSIPVQAVNSEAAGHPHNDYLRIRHDFGWVGLGIWMTSYTMLLIQCTRYWIWSVKRDPVTQHVHQACILAMIATLIMMLTDNIIVYQFAMVPLGILIGNSLGLGQARQKLLRQVKVMDWVDDLPEIEPSSPPQTP
ncbi:O-antigen ligase family protein [filamentous cyanobacterium LEGE 11480]|uniref:O-antigen ligase family protein n=1 Tax=Romeriopsis navalis LEGE 11480 TaxID=2777977 RepID=A0A928VRN0_9CYAN|nr:O-antigen ligase family protein [Romeriopsis navalis]MBE9031297.1 O-antigen ligase family protein [Romeriopsis navalis LEGE 11480]